MAKKVAYVLVLALICSILFVPNSFADGNWATYYELYPDPVITREGVIVDLRLYREMTDDEITKPGYIYALEYWKTDDPTSVQHQNIRQDFDRRQRVVLTNLEPDTEYTYKVWGQINTTNLEGTPETLSFKTLPSTPIPDDNYTIIYGDVNGDGEVDSLDLSLLKRMILRKGGDVFIDRFITEADLDGDGQIDSLDCTLLKRYILRKIKEFPVEEKIIIEGVSEGFVEANSQFAFNIFKQISKEEQGENVFISPFGISTALSMVYQGAGSDTKDEMAKVLGYDGLEISEVNKSYKYLLKYFSELNQDVKLKNSNSIWINSLMGNVFKEDFISTNKDVFNTLVETRDFSDENVVDEINGWISEATEGKINNMLGKVSPDILSYIISALYFNGTWKEEFDAEKTFSTSFKAEDGSTEDIMMMSKTGKLEYGEGDGYKAVRLPYGENGEMAMYCILPDEGTPIDDFIQKMDLSLWNEIKSNIVERGNVVLNLPRFKMEYAMGNDGSIKESLKALGMVKAFGEGADFSGMSDEAAGLGDVLHKAVVEVNEKGTEAASVIVIPVIPGVGIRPVFQANRPFVFVIADEKYDTILFMGKLSNGNLNK